MSWNGTITLLTPKQDPAGKTDQAGFAKPPEYERNEVFCDNKSVGFKEFYQSQQKGQSVRHKIDIYTVDYNNERFAEYEGVQYTILRTYAPEKHDGEITELTLTDVLTGAGV